MSRPPLTAHDRDLAADLVQHLVRDAGEHVGGDEAGGDGVDGQPDPVAERALGAVELEDGLLGQRLGQAEHAGLGGGVVDLADVAGLADDRGHVDDPAGAADDHVLDRGLGHVKGSGQVDRDDLLPVIVGHLGHGPVNGDPGVVHQDVDPAVLADHLMQHASAVIGAADVALMDGDPLAWIVAGRAGQELLRGLMTVPVAGRDMRALVGQFAADGGAYAAGAAGDQRHPALDHAGPGLFYLLHCGRPGCHRDGWWRRRDCGSPRFCLGCWCWHGGFLLGLRS